MSETSARAHPYIPNSATEIKEAMLREIGVSSIDELYGSIPAHLRLDRPLELPEALPSEYALRRHMEELLGRNSHCKGSLSFLGGGCWQHYVPAVCDEVANRAEFLTAYYGDGCSDHGKLQAAFEFASMMGELLELDVVSMPTYDWGSAAATAICMAARVTGRGSALVPSSMGAERTAIVEGYCGPWVEIVSVPMNPATGGLDIDGVHERISTDTACVYVENPSYLGTLDAGTREAADAAHEVGALFVAGVDPITLGVVEAPPRYGADLVCGEIQPLGVHMHYGGGLAGFVASPDEERYVSEYPTFLTGLAPTSVEGEYGFGEVVWERMSYVQRGDSKEYTGTTQVLWAIAAASYLALMGPTGLAELGRGIMQRARYAAMRLGELPGVSAPALGGPFFKEFVVDFEGTGKTVAEINAALLEQEIFGGNDLSVEFPELGQSALYCVTEIHTKSDIDRLVDVLGEVLS